jgi:polysaccharide pyruvyl transferase WcaK-like protein
MSELRIGLVGFFGWGNFGDELFLETHQHFLGDLGHVEPINDLTVKPYFTEPVEDVVDRYDAFVIGGGDLLIPWQMSELYWKAEYLRKPVFVAGIGVPTWKTSKPHVVARYKKFLTDPAIRLVLARDVESARWMDREIGLDTPIGAFPDLVCAMKLPQRAARSGESPVLGVVLRHRRTGADDLSKVREMCDDAKAKGYRVRHLVLGSKSVGQLDLEVAQTFAADDEEVVHHESPLDMCAEIGSLDMLASMKFHGTVVASMYGVPSVVMSPTDKSRNFLRLLERPDLLSSFGAETLRKRIPHYPVPVPSATRSRLRRKAVEGYEVLHDAIASEFQKGTG